MADFQLAASHLGSTSDELAFEPQRANNGIIVVDKITGWNLPSGIDGDSCITLALESFPIPEDENSVLEMHYMNEVQKAAGPARTLEMEVVVKDFVDVAVAQYLLQWRRRVYNPEAIPAVLGGIRQGAVGLAKNYKTTAAVYLFAPDGSTNRHYTLQGVWPSKLSPGSVDMTSEDQVKITMVLQVDRIMATNLTPGNTGL